MSKVMKLKLWDLIERLDVLTTWDHEEYLTRFGISKAKKSKEIRNELRELLEIPNGNWK
jgi:DNA-directed RNA polymerase subunit F